MKEATIKASDKYVLQKYDKEFDQVRDRIVNGSQIIEVNAQD